MIQTPPPRFFYRTLLCSPAHDHPASPPLEERDASLSHLLIHILLLICSEEKEERGGGARGGEGGGGEKSSSGCA
ncbi:hypothetical protein PUN28_000519 [Cardiocondyla obscurior]|uniref:Uncharacterized protein n=1 Tax=Cardiocondyla obscurior TaxID=286306 RepID=A0AAW2GZY1_9HYME